MSHPWLRPIFLLAGLSALAAPVRAATVDVEIPRHRGDYYDQAAFHLWLPDDAGPVRGIAVVLDGINVDGRHLAGRVQWQNFARDHSLALVACYFSTEDLSLATYCQAKGGSGQALLQALTHLGQASGHPEFETVPLFLLGFSAGGQFSYSFACFRPSRVAAFVTNKGGIYATPATAAAREVPGLFIAGANDESRRRSAIQEIYTKNRKLGARWCLAIEPQKGHTTGNANDLALPFFEAVMRSWDLPAAERTGIVLDLAHRQLIPPGTPPKGAGMTFWFPDPETIKVWNRFITTPR